MQFYSNALRKNRYKAVTGLVPYETKAKKYIFIPYLPLNGTHHTLKMHIITSKVHISII